MAKLTVKGLMDLKGKRQITCTTAHDYFTARACNDAGIDVIVTSGEFIKQYICGEFVKTNETINDLLIALEGVRKGAPDAFIYASIPHCYPYASNEQCIMNAAEAIRNGADAIYYSGVSYERIRALREAQIPVVGHAGMIPWHQTWVGGTHACGKTADDAYEVYQTALKMQEAGCIAIELECVPEKVAAEITKRLTIPVISMGSGFECDGQYLFSHDILGQHDGFYPRHSLIYETQFENAQRGMKAFVDDVASGEFNKKQKTINIKDEEFDGFLKKLK